MKRIILFILLTFALSSCNKSVAEKCEFKIEVPENVKIDTQVSCSDLSTGVVSRLWHFSGANVLETTEQNPVVCFIEAGIQACSISIKFSDGTNASQDFYVNVEKPEPEPDPYKDYTDIKGLILKSPITVVQQPSNMPKYGYWPETKLIPIKKGNSWQMFWANSVDYLTGASSPWPEDQILNIGSAKTVFGKGFSSIPNVNENGSWFIAVFPKENGHYVGFFHGESHWEGGGGTAYKTLGVAYSDDYGVTWKDAAPILTDDDPKGETPSWSGLGDGCVVWDEKTERYICYYQSIPSSGGSSTLCMAASSDPEGRSGTWKKWDGEDFTIEGYNKETGLGGPNVAVDKLTAYPGGNPSIIWSTYLNKWVLAYYSWKKMIFMSFSDDCLHWSTPFKIEGDATKNVPAMIPCFICEDGDKTCGQTVKMYFSHNQSTTTGKREIGRVEIVFK